MNQIEKSHGGSLNNWVGGLMHITVQTHYDLQYITMRLSGHMNEPTEPAFLALKHSLEYLMHHPQEPIMYSRRKIHRTEEIPHQCYFKAGDAETRKNKEHSNFLHKYSDSDHAMDISHRPSVTSTVHILNGTIIDWCTKKQY